MKSFLIFLALFVCIESQALGIRCERLFHNDTSIHKTAANPSTHSSTPKPQTTAEATLVQNLEKTFETSLSVDVQGLSQKVTWTDLRRKIYETPEFARVAKDLVDDKYDFMMQRKSDRRDLITENGFMNQHQVNESSGVLDIDGRNIVESVYANMDLAKYKKIKPQEKPKYGFLAEQNNLSKYLKNLDYGDDIYVFKKKDLSPRTTFTVGDSYNTYKNVWMMTFAITDVFKSDNWSMLFTPWSKREILAPFIAKSSKLKIPQDVSLKRNEKLGRMYPSSEYIELQFFGEVNLNNVEKFIFTDNPPQGAFKEELIKRQIQTFEFKNGELREWF